MGLVKSILKPFDCMRLSVFWRVFSFFTKTNKFANCCVTGAVIINHITFGIFNKFMPDFLQKFKIGQGSISFFIVLLKMCSRGCVPHFPKNFGVA